MMGFKNFVKNFFCVFLAANLLFFVGCAKYNGTNATQKDLFSNWTATDGSGLILNLTGAAFGTPLTIYFLTANGGQCYCSLSATGTQSSGTYNFSSCTYASGTGSGNPGCTSLNGSGTFTKSATVLTTCPSGGGCINYQ